jgi:deazaflavin-dependent oxidoreductase (nitroreductase family)
MSSTLEGRVRSVDSSRMRAIAYWTATLLIAAEFGVGGVMDALHLPPFSAALLQLGYPAYFGVILGVWKVLGAIVVLAPRLPRAKEWAYAGMIINLTAAVASLLAMGGGVGDVAVPLAFIGLAAVSWAARPPSRMAAMKRPDPHASRVPSWVWLLNPIARRLIAVGVPMGPDVLITVRGRRTGLPRTTAVAVAEISGRLWLVSPWGEVNWARNLRAAGRATLTARRQETKVTAVELGPTEAVEFFRDILAPYLRGNRVGAWIVRHIDGIDVTNPSEAARSCRVFELQPVDRDDRAGS